MLCRPVAYCAGQLHIVQICTLGLSEFDLKAGFLPYYNIFSLYLHLGCPPSLSAVLPGKQKQGGAVVLTEQ